MKTAYLNPFGQSAYQIIYNYGNITRITQETQEINNIIENTHNQDKKKVNTIKELCYEKIRQHYQQQLNKKSNKYKYLYTQEITETDTIATHTLLQATALSYGTNSYEADLITQIITNTTKQRIETIPGQELIDNTLKDYLDPNNTTLNDIIPLIDNTKLQLKDLILNKNKVILTYTDFLTHYGKHLEHRNPEQIYTLLCHDTKKKLITALIEKQTREYLKLIEDKQKQIEPAPIILDIAKKIRKIEQEEKQKQIQQYNINNHHTHIDETKAAPYNTEAFPPCIQKALRGTKTGGRNYTISILLTSFLSYARLYPGVYAKHKKNPQITDNDPDLTITRNEILPLIYRAAQNCTPPLLTDQPHEKQNIHNKLGFTEGKNGYTNIGKTPWYTPPNCKSIQNTQPELCTPSSDCKKIGNPLSYYNRKRKLLRGDDKNDEPRTSN